MAYEGMNVMSTVDNKLGIIRIVIMPGFENDMDALISQLSKQVWMNLHYRIQKLFLELQKNLTTYPPQFLHD